MAPFWKIECVNLDEVIVHEKGGSVGERDSLPTERAGGAKEGASRD